MSKNLKNKMLEAIFIAFGFKKENVKIAEICSKVAKLYYSDRSSEECIEFKNLKENFRPRATENYNMETFHIKGKRFSFPYYGPSTSSDKGHYFIQSEESKQLIIKNKKSKMKSLSKKQTDLIKEKLEDLNKLIVPLVEKGYFIKLYGGHIHYSSKSVMEENDLESKALPISIKITNQESIDI